MDFNPRSMLVLATGGADHTARITEVEGGAELAVLERHAGPVTRAVFFPIDGAPFLVTTGYDGAVFLWDLKFIVATTDGLRRVEKRPRNRVAGLDVAVSSVAVAEIFGALRVFAGCHDAKAWMWTVQAKSVLDKESW